MVYFISKMRHTYEILANSQAEAEMCAKVRVDNNDEGDEVEIFDDEIEHFHTEMLGKEDIVWEDGPDCEEKRDEMVRFRLPTGVRNAFKKHCVNEGYSMQIVLESLLLKYLADANINKGA